MLRFTHRRAVDKISQMLRTAGAEHRLMFATCADSSMRQEISDNLTQDGAVQQIPTVITPGEPVPKVVREHKGGHANNKLYVIEGLTEAIGRGGEGFFELLAQQGGYFTNHGTWCLIWLTDPETRLRLERQSARLFQSAVYNPTFFTMEMIEPRPGAMPEIAVPSLAAGDPDGRLAALSAKLRRKGDLADQVELAEELARLGDQLSARELFQKVMASNEPWRVRAARGLYRLGALPVEEVGQIAHQVPLEERPEALLLFAQSLEDANEEKRAEAVYQEAFLLSQDPANKLSTSIAKSQFLRRQKKPKEASALLQTILPNEKSPIKPEDAPYAPLWIEAGRVEIDVAFMSAAQSEEESVVHNANNERSRGANGSPIDGSDPTERLQKAQRLLERGREIALVSRPPDEESAHQADTYLVGLHVSMGDEATALTVLDKALKRAEKSGYKTLALDAYRTRMGLFFELGENSGAMASLQLAVKLAKQIGYPDLEASVLRDQADVEERLGNVDKAKKLNIEAETLEQFSS